LLSTIGWQQDGVRHYALEGSIFVAGSLIKWLRDTLGLIASAAESEALAREVEDNGGVYLVPAHSGLGAPHWNPHARGQISGLGLGSAKAHIVRAALEAMAYQTHDLQAAFAADGAPWSELRIDGGMSVNDWMAQDLADILQVPVIRPDFVETTAKGAAILAAVGCGMYPSLQAAVAGMIGECRTFVPAIGASERTNRLAGWQAALAGVLMGRE
jgi:glycerol kinase